MQMTYKNCFIEIPWPFRTELGLQPKLVVPTSLGLPKSRVRMWTVILRAQRPFMNTSCLLWLDMSTCNIAVYEAWEASLHETAVADEETIGGHIDPAV